MLPCILSKKELHICNCAMNKATHATCDRTKKDSLFGGYYAITDTGSAQLKWSSNR